MGRIRKFLMLPAIGIGASVVAGANHTPTFDPTDPSQVAQREADDTNQSPASDLSGPRIDLSAAEQTRPGGGGAMAGLTVETLLTRECGQCHGPRRQKAGVQLVPIESIYQGPQVDWVVRPGNPSESLLLQRILLPADHPDVMPPEGQPMNVTQTKLVETWIAQGATADAARVSTGSQRPAPVPPRVWAEAYLSLQLTPDQRSVARREFRNLQTRLQAFRSTHGEEMRRLQRSFRNGPNPPGMSEADRTTARSRMQELRRQQPQAEPIQAQLWKALNPQQQEQFRQQLQDRWSRREGQRQNQMRHPDKSKSDRGPSVTDSPKHHASEGTVD